MMEEGGNRNGRGRALAIFWDLKSCPIPESFLAYGDPNDFPDHLLRSWERDGMKLLDAGEGYNLYKRIIDDIVAFTLHHIFSPPLSSMIVVITAEKWPVLFLRNLKHLGMGPVLVIPSDRATRWDTALGLVIPPRGQEAAPDAVADGF
ncbi:hypothetical protein MLD38_013584 [Melastoma candidum]|uniref:Uncharacterized protein n=1 Tax=Melastoma candidum TaxID=119954 RepID=A0ACB9RIJ1_9MYRT|nr:hypothetical protein MLD38_013584 [Melastoma candidum]